MSGCATSGWPGKGCSTPSRVAPATVSSAHSKRWRPCCDGSAGIVSTHARDQLRGGIIAAGEGSRLRRDGFTVPKPLVEVAGVALIEAVIRNFEAARVRPLVIIVNEQELDCVERVRERFPSLPVRFIVKTTASSLESFCEVTGTPGAGCMLVSTVDAWCRPADFTTFVQAAMDRPPGSTVLAVTPFVADEKPL